VKLLKQAVKAELRKLFTVRTTYVSLGIALGLITFVSFYIQGIKSTGPFNDTGLYAAQVGGAINIASIFIAVLAILLVTHEYRYNTIIYTLTATKRRTHVLLAKVITVSALALFFGLAVAVLAPFLTALALQVRGAEVVHQVIAPLDLLWKNLFTIWGFGMIGLVISMLVRSQVAAVATLFLLPTMIESLLRALLNDNVAYLPFNSLTAVASGGKLTPLNAAVVFMVWMAVGLIVSWQLFIRRDAN